jgi:site-specific recombinase XerD
VSTETARGAPLLAEAIDRFGAALIAKSPRTAANYKSALRRFVEFLPALGLEPGSLTTDRLPPDVLERFYTALLQDRGRAHRSTAVAYVTEVRVFCRFLARQRWLHPECSYERMQDGLRELIGRVPYRTPRVDGAMARIVTYVQSVALPPRRPEQQQRRLVLLRDRAVLTTLYGTALRREEISRLNRSDVQDGYSAEGLITGKGDKERTVFFDEAALAAIRAYLAERHDSYPPLFLRHDDGRGAPGPRGAHWRLSPQSIWGIVKRYGALTGIEVTTHHLRHLKARVMLNNGAQLSEVQDILGHASPETTKKIYAQYTTQHLREAFDRFSLPADVVAARARPRPPREEGDGGTAGR